MSAETKPSSCAAPVSRSALGRYAQKAEAQMQRYREAQEVAKVWVDKLEAEPQGDVARLLPEMLRSVAFQTLGAMSERDDAVDAQEVMLLAKALDHLSKTSKAQLEVELKLRQERERIQKKLADLETEALSGRSMRRLDLETLRVIREDVYGIAA